MHEKKSRRTPRAIAVVTVIALVGLAPIRAFAADTTVTAEITGGLLTIAAPASADLGAVSAAVGSTLNSNLGTTTVQDDRGSLLGWTVTAVSDGNMVGSNPSNTISLATPSPLEWLTGSVSASGSSLLTGVAAGAGGGITASTPVTVATAALGAGGGVYTYDPSLTLTVPPNTYADTYTVTITQTVA